MWQHSVLPDACHMCSGCWLQKPALLRTENKQSSQVPVEFEHSESCCCPMLLEKPDSQDALLAWMSAPSSSAFMHCKINLCPFPSKFASAALAVCPLPCYLAMNLDGTLRTVLLAGASGRHRSWCMDCSAITKELRAAIPAQPCRQPAQDLSWYTMLGWWFNGCSLCF